jgi:hypothetical protein
MAAGGGPFVRPCAAPPPPLSLAGATPGRCPAGRPCGRGQLPARSTGPPAPSPWRVLRSACWRLQGPSRGSAQPAVRAPEDSRCTRRCRRARAWRAQCFRRGNPHCRSRRRRGGSPNQQRSKPELERSAPVPVLWGGEGRADCARRAPSVPEAARGGAAAAVPAAAAVVGGGGAHNQPPKESSQREAEYDRDTREHTRGGRVEQRTCLYQTIRLGGVGCRLLCSAWQRKRMGRMRGRPGDGPRALLRCCCRAASRLACHAWAGTQRCAAARPRGWLSLRGRARLLSGSLRAPPREPRGSR